MGAQRAGGKLRKVVDRSRTGAPHSSVRSLAEALAIPRKTLHDKLRKHGLNFGDSSHPMRTNEQQQSTALEEVLHHDIPLTRDMGLKVLDWRDQH
jgi:hypothetical protein